MTDLDVGREAWPAVIAPAGEATLLLGKGGLHGEELGGSLRPYRMPGGTHLAPGLSKRCLVLRHS